MLKLPNLNLMALGKGSNPARVLCCTIGQAHILPKSKGKNTESSGSVLT